MREAPYYEIPTINIGNRQNNRVKSKSINSIDFDAKEILLSINKAKEEKRTIKDVDFGDGNSDKKFFELLKDDKIWNISNQKQFRDLV